MQHDSLALFLQYFWMGFQPALRALFISVSILRDDGSDPLRDARQREPPNPHWMHRNRRGRLQSDQANCLRKIAITLAKFSTCTKTLPVGASEAKTGGGQRDNMCLSREGP